MSALRLVKLWRGLELFNLSLAGKLISRLTLQNKKSFYNLLVSGQGFDEHLLVGWRVSG